MGTDPFHGVQLEVPALERGPRALFVYVAISKSVSLVFVKKGMTIKTVNDVSD